MTARADQARIPALPLASGAQIPAIGVGTFGSDRHGSHEVAAAVEIALELGYRHIDCAAVYGNEAAVGEALHAGLAAGLDRAELWVTSKLWNDSHERVREACERSLADLQLDYLDLYLVHWPFPNHHSPGVDVTSRDPHARPYIHQEYLRTWRQMESLVEAGLVRHIGTSNMTIPKLRRLLLDAEIPPSCNEMELHPHFQQPELFDYVVEQGIVPIGFSPIGSPARPDRDRTPGDSVDIDDPVIREIATTHGVHPAVVCIKWAVQRGQVPIPFSINRDNLAANLHALASTPLSNDEMERIRLIDRNCRLIKGQVFLWEGANGWEDLWDLEESTAEA